MTQEQAIERLAEVLLEPRDSKSKKIKNKRDWHNYMNYRYGGKELTLDYIIKNNL